MMVRRKDIHIGLFWVNAFGLREIGRPLPVVAPSAIETSAPLFPGVNRARIRGSTGAIWVAFPAI
jgi:hypothetical protein